MPSFQKSQSVWTRCIPKPSSIVIIPCSKRSSGCFITMSSYRKICLRLSRPISWQVMLIPTGIWEFLRARASKNIRRCHFGGRYAQNDNDVGACDKNQLAVQSFRVPGGLCWLLERLARRLLRARKMQKLHWNWLYCYNTWYKYSKSYDQKTLFLK